MESQPLFMSSTDDGGLEQIIGHLRQESFEAVSANALFGGDGLEEWLYANNLECGSAIPDTCFSGEEFLSVEGDRVAVTATKGRRDRSRSLVSERRRRGHMKEKLYQLRALVPNITRMDKASIIGDAEAYIRDLQNQAKALEEEIKGLESLGGGDGSTWYPFETLRGAQIMDNKRPIEGKISRTDVFRVGERTFYVRLVCIGGGASVSAALYASFESVPCFHVVSSNFSAAAIGESMLSLTLQVGARPT
ncbi:Transcription factor FER-LIKE IRON DEFICIENCY-INDUCED TRANSCRIPTION FACTOR [Acorus gramineus]|uniref:Transcription factor FER-LIKE IRON DEFICIENCY-INDUCED TRANSCRIPTION FACTOR n=1 Tax=Acorus gramineus TaxID=55184 RepID=A0AAV9B5U5_ACOGR|nr:Transcription factor FER-LIKE IRON DEFICIENCY-INDUCED TRANSCRIPTION FACTOR [Acorus gramineus]